MIASDLVDPLTDLVRSAVAAVLGVEVGRYQAKPDGSPVTAADLAAEAKILDGLVRLAPGIAVISEESRPQMTAGAETFFLIDPLDGTREFISGRNEYTINLALVHRGRPLLGIVAAPALGLLWRGMLHGGAERLDLQTNSARPIRTRLAPPEGLSVVHSRSHLDRDTASLVSRWPVNERQECGSSLKFCRLAEGAADVYPRLAPVHEWDIAAGHAVLLAAGGTVLDGVGDQVTYGRLEARLTVPGFIAWGDPAAPARVWSALAR